MANEVSASIVTGVRAEGAARHHRIPLDEPTEQGGTDEGMTPVEAFMVSLASCAAITIRMYADRKGWNLSGVRVNARLDRPGGDVSPKLVHEIELRGDLDDAQRERLRIIGGRCPVHRLVEGPLEMEERLA